MQQTLMDILSATWDMTLAAAPWLVVGLVVAALIKVYVPVDWLTRFLHGRGGVIKAAFIGAPLPLCSCGVIPAALALRRQGASRGAVMSFLVATPETGVDSVAVSYALLGPFLAVVRPVAAISSAIATGLIGAAVPERGEAGSSAVEESSTVESPGGCCSEKSESSCCETSAPKSSCCEGETAKTTAGEPASAGGCCGTTEAKPTSSCCSSDTDMVTRRKPGLFASLIEAAADVLGDTMKWLVIGLLLAGVISVFITPEVIQGWGSGLPVMILMVLVGIPMYICATASTPLAAGLLLAGLSPGAVLVFMMAGPATNVATLGVVRREMGTRHMIVYLVTVSVSAILCGLATDAIAAALSINALEQARESYDHEMIPRWLAITCLVILIVLAVKPMRTRLVPLTMQPA
jgi:uncharacterized protein